MHLVLLSLFLSLAPAACQAATASPSANAGPSAPAPEHDATPAATPEHEATPAAAPEREPAAKPKLSLEDACAVALKRVPGTVVSAELEREHGRWVYSVEIQPSDRRQPRKEVEIDDDDGSVLAIEDEDDD